MLYDLTSTYFECDPPSEGKRKHGYSRDKRPDCVQVVIALIVTPEGFPLAYDVLAGNTSDKTTLGDFLAKISSSSCSSSSFACRHSRRPGSLSQKPPKQSAVVPTFRGYILLNQIVRPSQ